MSYSISYHFMISFRLETVAMNFLPLKKKSKSTQNSDNKSKKLKRNWNVYSVVLITIIMEAEKLLNNPNTINACLWETLESSLMPQRTVRRKCTCTVHQDHVCKCPCYKDNALCKHSPCITTCNKGRIFKEHFEYLSKSPCCA